MENEINNSELIRAIGKLEGKMDLMVSSVANLASSFESLEKGRLSRLEIQFASLVTETRDEATKVAKNSAFWTAIWVSVIAGLTVTILGGLVLYFLTK